MKEKIGECFIFIGFLLLYDNCDVKLYEILFSFIEICLIEIEKLKLIFICDGINECFFRSYVVIVCEKC